MRVVDDITGFQKKLLQCEVPNVAVSGGLGLGKTAVAARFCAYQMIEFPGSMGALACPTYPQLFQSNFIEIEQILAKYGLRYKWQPMFKKLTLSNGSTLFFKSFDVPEGNLKGPEYDYGVIEEADGTMKPHYSTFADRIGRNKKQRGSGLLRVFGNPVPYSHWMHEEFRQRDLPNYELWEVPTYQNRRYLADGYIEKLEARYEEGTPGYKRWLLGQCGVPSDKAVYGEFDLTTDTITEEQIAAEGGIASHKSALYFGRTGLPHGYVLAGLTRQGTLVALEEVYTNNKPVKFTANQIKGVHPGGSILADPYHALRKDYRREKLSMRKANTDRLLGVPRFRNIIAEGNFKVRADSNSVISCPHLRNELESHETGDANLPETKNCSLIIPMEYMASSMKDNLDPAQIKRLRLNEVFDFEPGAGQLQHGGSVAMW